MPHLILEYSNNLANDLNVRELFTQLHQLLARELPTQLSSCKSRCIVSPVYHIGDGHQHNAFVHLTIKIMAGRTDAKKKQVGIEVLNRMGLFFHTEKAQFNVQLSVEILDLDLHYFKG